MRGPLLVMFSDIYMTKLEKDTILPPRKRKLYKCFVNGIFTRLKYSVPYQTLEFFNNYHPNIKLIYEIYPEKFPDSKICYNNSSINTEVHQKVTKLTPDCSSSIPKR